MSLRERSTAVVTSLLLLLVVGSVGASCRSSQFHQAASPVTGPGSCPRATEADVQQINMGTGDSPLFDAFEKDDGQYRYVAGNVTGSKENGRRLDGAVFIVDGAQVYAVNTKAHRASTFPFAGDLPGNRSYDDDFVVALVNCLVWNG